jgi:hypothetical protein
VVTTAKIVNPFSVRRKIATICGYVKGVDDGVDRGGMVYSVDDIERAAKGLADWKMSREQGLID